MRKSKFALVVALCAMTGAAIAETAQEKRVREGMRLIRRDFQEVVDVLHDGNTQVTRERWWSSAKGKRTQVSGRVLDVKESGWVMPMKVEIAPRSVSDRVQVSCYLKKGDTSGESIARNLRVGSQVKCSGKLDNYVLLMNSLSLSISESSIEVQ